MMKMNKKAEETWLARKDLKNLLSNNVSLIRYINQRLLMDKKAEETWLAGRTLGWIIAALCIVLILVPLGVKLYASMQEVNIDKVVGDLNEISSLIEQAKSGIDGKALINVPKNWQIVSFYQDFYKPVQCGEFCVCICSDNDIKSCEKEEKYCKDFDNKVVIRGGKIGIDETIELKANKIADGFEVYKNE